MKQSDIIPVRKLKNDTKWEIGTNIQRQGKTLFALKEIESGMLQMVWADKTLKRIAKECKYFRKVGTEYSRSRNCVSILEKYDRDTALPIQNVLVKQVSKAEMPNVKSATITQTPHKYIHSMQNVPIASSLYNIVPSIKYKLWPDYSSWVPTNRRGFL